MTSLQHVFDAAFRVAAAAYLPVATLLATACVAGCSTSSPTVEGEAAQLVVSRVGPAYPQELPVVGTAAARAVARHGADRLDIINLGPTPWQEDARLWVNGRYSARLTNIEPGKFAGIRFETFVDATGERFPTDNRQVLVRTVELQQGDELAAVRVAFDR